MGILNVEMHRDLTYSINIQKGITVKLNTYKDFFFRYEKVAIVTDDNVSVHYLRQISRQISSMGCKVHEIIIKAGENSKNLASAEGIYHHFSDYNMTRGDLVVALGGGVVGDLAGFCASTYLRGIDFIQIPTTLLSQVDSSIGGKVGVNLSKGKNLVGSFYQPRLVLTDPGVLKTLPERIFSDGMAEVIKYGCIYDASLFDQLLSLDKENLEEDLEGIIETCARIKKEVTEKDEMESGLRKILNFGHTLGHVIETYFNYQKYSHGEAVAIGMHYITQQSERKGITREGTADKIRDILIKYNLPYKMPDLEKNKVLEILARDKKFSGDKISLVLLKSIGQVTLVGFDKNQLTEFIL